MEMSATIIVLLLSIYTMYGQFLMYRDRHNNPFSRSVVSTTCTKLTYECRGTRQNDIVVFLQPGHTQSAWDYDIYMDFFAQYTEVCRYERPGFGNSEPAEDDDVKIDNYAENMKSVLQDLDPRPDKVILVGHSKGDPTCRYFQNKYLNDDEVPEVIGLIMLDGAYTPAGPEAHVTIGGKPVSDSWRRGRMKTAETMRKFEPLVNCVKATGLVRPFGELKAPLERCVGYTPTFSKILQVLGQMRSYHMPHHWEAVIQENEQFGDFYDDLAETTTNLQIDGDVNATFALAERLSKDELQERCEWKYQYRAYDSFEESLSVPGHPLSVELTPKRNGTMLPQLALMCCESDAPGVPKITANNASPGYPKDEPLQTSPAGHEFIERSAETVSGVRADQKVVYIPGMHAACLRDSTWVDKAKPYIKEFIEQQIGLHAPDSRAGKIGHIHLAEAENSLLKAHRSI